MVMIQNMALRTSFRSEIQATDSTCMGCNAKSAATNAPFHNARLKTLRTKKQYRINDMKQQRHEMVGPRIHPEQRNIKHVDSQVSGASCSHNRF